MQKAKYNVKKYGWKNVEFLQWHIEIKISVDDNSVDIVINNCVINLSSNKVKTLKEIYRILKPKVGIMIISNLVTDKEDESNSIDTNNWCIFIDYDLTKDI